MSIGWIDSWIVDSALPLWTGPAMHPDGAGVWESLDQSGQPMPGRRRFRVQVRQVWAFATLGQRLGRPDLVAKAAGLFEFAMRVGFTPEGRLAAVLDAQGAVLDAPHDLYDLAFVHLALSALIEAGVDVSDGLDRAEAALALLEMDQGWAENAAGSLPRRQNPHMHLFEASVALYRATSLARYQTRAEACLELLRRRFLRQDGVLLEYFGPDWQPVTEGQQIEPGHMAEWIWLLDLYEQTFGKSCRVELGQIWAQVVGFQDPSGLLPDTLATSGQPRRLWPQTELLRASLVMHKRGVALAKGLHPADVLQRLRTEYLATPCAGGWFDRVDVMGQPVDANAMPASSFYHILGALLACKDAGSLFDFPGPTL